MQLDIEALRSSLTVVVPQKPSKSVKTEVNPCSLVEVEPRCVGPISPLQKKPARPRAGPTDEGNADCATRPARRSGMRRPHPPRRADTPFNMAHTSRARLDGWRATWNAPESTFGFPKNREPRPLHLEPPLTSQRQSRQMPTRRTPPPGATAGSSAGHTRKHESSAHRCARLATPAIGQPVPKSRALLCSAIVTQVGSTAMARLAAARSRTAGGRDTWRKASVQRSCAFTSSSIPRTCPWHMKRAVPPRGHFPGGSFRSDFFTHKCPCLLIRISSTLPHTPPQRPKSTLMLALE